MKGYITLIISSIALLSFSQITVTHYNSDWNSENSYDISTLKDCSTSHVMICHNPELQEKHNIKSVPTIIVFNDSKEVARFEANILMKRTIEKKLIQKEIDKIMLSKFE